MCVPIFSKVQFLRIRNMCSNWAMDSTWVVGGPNGNTIWEVRSFYFLLFVLCFLHVDEKM